ncbi:UNVERIFIED_CONTAM: Response regulator containing CheY-like receiver, AAA-type ATPase, and DNA-binding domains [Acetivibrio alkalicellulosi]
MNFDSINNKAIVLVDDERIVLDSLKSEISAYIDYEYTVEIAENSFEALELVEDLLSDDFDIPIVIADYIMPGMKGDVLLKEIHKKSPCTLKILLTGQAAMEGVITAINEADLYKYFDKPWDKEELKKSITDAFEIYFEKKKHHDELLFVLNKEIHLKEEIKKLESSLNIITNSSSEDVSIILSQLSTLNEIYTKALKIKNMLNFKYKKDTDEKRIVQIACEFDNLKKMLKLIEIH